MQSIDLVINGNKVSREVETRTLLVEFLREELNLTGTHIGCDTAQCGACIVHIDGEAVKSCAVLVAEINGCEIRTIEGMANADGSPGPIQKAFQDNHGLQCGFCTPGMVMSAADLLNINNNPSEADIRGYLRGNFCRCTGYQNIVKSILAAAKNMS